MYENRITNGRFDVPNIRKFEVVGLDLPELDEFRTSSSNREWESDIRVACELLTPSWCPSLSKLLRQLSSSRISLSVHMAFPLSHDYSTAYDGDGLPTPVVEILKVYGDDPQLLPVFLKALLRRCRPKCLTAFNEVYYQRHDATLNWYPAFECYYRRHEIDEEKRDAALLQVMDQ
ncbi:uncharacterized protein LOC121750872 [Salvia splendens]|nr:uncharacterized protein LOC121750872 [Salvia splendens]